MQLLIRFDSFTLLHAAQSQAMSLTNCRFYEEKYPEIESFVMVNVKQVWPKIRDLGYPG